ncbi:hypothetical protein TSOC_000831 [Tetrabaena socialis]|uniref:Uncharacterized protein n=1 Tax=Tetrabaena socialis TaxID=47790 RepID=A0A2J8AI80_9CHLO|nr:hypothetical protein TSOC_000831 [Tetrabaena socialis]|eukprot:PNH12220.1 hypothetical protein TSOC_000831 [Tetrabaena socialis]
MPVQPPAEAVAGAGGAASAVGPGTGTAAEHAGTAPAGAAAPLRAVPQPDLPAVADAPPDPSHVWLLMLVLRFAGRLPPNEKACSLRLVDKGTAAALRGPQHATIRLSKPLQPDAHMRSGAASSLAWRHRSQLRLQTARSGSIANLWGAACCQRPPLAAELTQEAAASGDP